MIPRYEITELGKKHLDVLGQLSALGNTDLDDLEDGVADEYKLDLDRFMLVLASEGLISIYYNNLPEAFKQVQEDVWKPVLYPGHEQLHDAIAYMDAHPTEQQLRFPSSDQDWQQLAQKISQIQPNSRFQADNNLQTILNMGNGTISISDFNAAKQWMVRAAGDLNIRDY